MEIFSPVTSCFLFGHSASTCFFWRFVPRTSNVHDFWSILTNCNSFFFTLNSKFNYLSNRILFFSCESSYQNLCSDFLTCSIRGFLHLHLSPFLYLIILHPATIIFEFEVQPINTIYTLMCRI